MARTKIPILRLHFSNGRNLFNLPMSQFHTHSIPFLHRLPPPASLRPHHYTMLHPANRHA